MCPSPRPAGPVFPDHRFVLVSQSENLTGLSPASLFFPPGSNDDRNLVGKRDSLLVVAFPEPFSLTIEMLGAVLADLAPPAAALLAVIPGNIRTRCAACPRGWLAGSAIGICSA